MERFIQKKETSIFDYGGENGNKIGDMKVKIIYSVNRLKKKLTFIDDEGKPIFVSLVAWGSLHFYRGVRPPPTNVLIYDTELH